MSKTHHITHSQKQAFGGIVISPVPAEDPIAGPQILKVHAVLEVVSVATGYASLEPELCLSIIYADREKTRSVMGAPEARQAGPISHVYVCGRRRVRKEFSRFRHHQLPC